ncbi:MAG: hypothetical protein DIU71_04825 [Proteobacteria bacterium]|nr:MAG: hypothetical protein DIU71_04825 [Pseudomonadota bacterium]
MEAEPPYAGRRSAAGGLLKSLGNMLGTLVQIVHTRLELLTTELQQEIHSAAILLLWAFVAAFAAMMTLFLGALTVIFVFWDTHRLAAALVMVAGFGALAVIAAMVLIYKLRTRPPLLDATLTELAKDRDRLRARL